MNYIALVAFVGLLCGCASGPPSVSASYSVDSTDSNENVLKANRDKSFVDQLNLTARNTGKLDAAPKLVHFVFPALPPQAMAGKVDVRLEVDKDGNVAKVDVAKSSHPLLSESVVTAARQWKFVPMTAGGSPTDFTVTQTFNFK